MNESIGTLELNEINLRKVALEIKAHGERYFNDEWNSNAPVEIVSRIMFIQEGSMYFNIDDRRFIASKNQLVLIPENRHVEYGVPKGGLVHCRYCNFTALFGDKSIWDHLSGSWFCNTDDPKKMKDLFQRFDRVDNENIIRDFIEKKMCLAEILSEFMNRAELKVERKKTATGIDLSGIADLIKRNAHSTDIMNLEYLAKVAHIHPSYFTREFKRQYGISPMQFVLEARTDAAKKLLSDRSLSIAAVAETMHFDNAKYFSKFFKRRTGMTPSEYRKQLKGAVQ